MYLPNPAQPPSATNVPIVNTSHPLVGNATNPQKSYYVGSLGATPELDPNAFASGSSAQCVCSPRADHLCRALESRLVCLQVVTPRL